MAQGKYWTITLNNYTDDDRIVFETIVAEGKAVYLCYQEEISPTNGTPHFQAFVSFKTNQRLGAVKERLGRRVHAILSDGSPSANRTYCQKPETAVPGSFREFGVIPRDPKRGKRTDFDGFKQAVTEGLTCKKKARVEFPEIVAKYPRWCYDLMADQQLIQIEDHELRQWQKDLNTQLQTEPDDRKIIFIVDETGGEGKTWFAKWYTKSHHDAQFMEPAKKADMAYALQDNLRVLFLNITRTSDSSNHEYLYSFIEAVKDGMVFSPKYESRMKCFSKVHVVVMMNQLPNVDLLSADRYLTIEL